MAIQLEFLNLVVPIHRIEDIYPDGWRGCLHDHAKSIGRIVWYDDHLFRTGTMDFDMMDNLIAKWMQWGFEATELVNGRTKWKDLCVVSPLGLLRQDCDWLILNSSCNIGWLKGADVGDVRGRVKSQPW